MSVTAQQRHGDSPPPADEQDQCEPPATGGQPPATARPSVRPVSIDVDPSSLIVAPIPRSPFWVGAYDDCPELVTPAGFEFPKFSGSVERGDDGTAKLAPRTHRGAVLMLSESDVETIKERVMDQVVVPRPNGRRIVSRKDRTYRPAPDHRPLGMYVYMAALSAPDAVARAASAPPPPPLIPRNF
jgi:hypothetical protein